MVTMTRRRLQGAGTAAWTIAIETHACRAITYKYSATIVSIVYAQENSGVSLPYRVEMLRGIGQTRVNIRALHAPPHLSWKTQGIVPHVGIHEQK